MHKSVLQLTGTPFKVSPSPYFLCGAAPHQETLAGLYYGMTPRINARCDNALISASALGREPVTPDLMDEAAMDEGLRRVKETATGQWRRYPPSPTKKRIAKLEDLLIVLRSAHGGELPGTGPRSSLTGGKD